MRSYQPITAQVEHNQPIRSQYSAGPRHVLRKEEAGVWSNVDTEMMTITCINTHYSGIDCVKVINNLMVIESRNRGINIWNTDSLRSTGDTNPAPSCLMITRAGSGVSHPLVTGQYLSPGHGTTLSNSEVSYQSSVVKQHWSERVILIILGTTEHQQQHCL